MNPTSNGGLFRLVFILSDWHEVLIISKTAVGKLPARNEDLNVNMIFLGCSKKGDTLKSFG
jgi:hypothetical protein